MKRLMELILCGILLCAGCAPGRVGSIKVQEVAKERAVAPMLRTIMWSSLYADVADPEWKQKMAALHSINVRGASGCLMLCRPQFCEYPWVAVAGQQGSSDATYNLMQMNPKWMAHLNEVVDYANTFNPPFMLQFDFLPHPTLRHGENMVFKSVRMLLSPLSLMEPEDIIVGQEGIHDDLTFKSNVQGIKANGTAIFNNTPTGAWAEVSRNWLAQTIPIINRAKFGAVLFVLEGSGSGACEKWYWDTARSVGLSPSIYVITNENMVGAVRSPHLHSTSAFKNSKPYYTSSDGWGPSAKDWRQCVDSMAKKGAPAIELWRKEFSDGSGGGDYAKRTRPSANYIARTCGDVVVAAGK